MDSIDRPDTGDRARLVARALDEISAGSGGDMIEAVHALTRWSVRLLDVTGAGVMMADTRGVLRSMMVSSEAVRVLEAAELDSGRGPCVESHRSSREVIHPDVDIADTRWPEFGTHARAGGMRAAHAIPVHGGGAAIGVLNLFRSTVGGLGEIDARLAQSMADAAGTKVNETPRPADPESLTVAIGDAAIVERVKGMLAVRLGIDVDTAHAVLRRVAGDEGRTVVDLAAAVAAGTATVTLPLSLPPQRPGTTGTD